MTKAGKAGPRLLRIFGIRKAVAGASILSAALFTGSVLGHDLTVSGTIAPANGSVITDSEVELHGTFGNSGCGITPSITVDVSDGAMSALTISCLDGLWSWSGTWSGYSAGAQWAKADFHATHGGAPFVHSGTITANYLIQTICEEPDAPAIANAYLRELGVTNRDHINTIIPEVAHAMNAGAFGENACAPGYAEAVRSFVQALYDELVD